MAAGLEKSGAVLATLAYRMASLWLPLLFAIPAIWWLRRNSGDASDAKVTPVPA